MARALTLHVGLEKTGTTYLQHGLAALRPQLAERGVLYPGSRHAQHGPARDRLRLTSNLADDSLLLRASSGSWARMCRELRGHPGDAIVSCEYFAWGTSNEASSILRELPARRFRVVVTTRPSVALLPSLWQEQVRHGEDRSLHEWMDASLIPAFSGEQPDRRLYRADAAQVIDNWTHPGVEMHVEPMQSGGPDFFGRFLTACDLPIDLAAAYAAVDQPRHVGNDRLGIELARRVNNAVPQSRDSLVLAGVTRPLIRVATRRSPPDTRGTGLCADHEAWAAQRDGARTGLSATASSDDRMSPDDQWCQGGYDGGPHGQPRFERLVRQIAWITRAAASTMGLLRMMPGVDRLLVKLISRTQY